jgi:hypothetical protein
LSFSQLIQLNREQTIQSMAAPMGDNLSLDAVAAQREVTDNIQQFVSRAFVFES